MSTPIMKLILVLGGALALLICGSAQAHTTIIEPATSHLPYQRWVDESKVPTPDVTLTVVEEPCPRTDMQFDACTAPGERKIWDTALAWPAQTRETFLHELGHNVDYAMPDWMRQRYMEILGLSGGWEDPSYSSGYTMPNELFAESWAECAIKPYLPPKAARWSGKGIVFEHAPVGGIINHNRICRMVSRLGAQ